MRRTNSIVLDGITQKMTINLNVRGAFMKNRVLSKMHCGRGTPKLKSKPFNHFSSHVAAAMNWYSASAEDRDTISCFFVFHDIGECPRKTNHPDTERWVSGQLAQSESHQLLKDKSQSYRRRMPCPRQPIKYRTTRMAASQWSCCDALRSWDNIWIENAKLGLVNAK